MQVVTHFCLGWASAHRRLDKAMQCTFIKISWTTSLSFVLTFYSLSKDEITDERVCALVRELQVNQSHQKLEWVQPFMSNFCLIQGWTWIPPPPPHPLQPQFPPTQKSWNWVWLLLFCHRHILNNNLVPGCIRSNLRGSKFKIFLGGHAPRPP